MKQQFWAALLLFASCNAVPSATAQGLSEYGGLMGAQGKPGMGGLHNAVQGLYGRAAGAKPGTSAVPSRLLIDPADAREYGSKAQAAYSAGLTAEKAGKTAEALRQYDYAVAIRQRVWGDKDPAVAEILRKEAAIYMKTGPADAAESTYKRLLAAETRLYGPGDPKLEKTLAKYAELCDKNGHYKDSANCYRQLVAIGQRYPSISANQTREARLKLGQALTLTNDYAAAEQSFKDAVTAEETAAQPNSEYLAKLYRGYAGLMRETNRENEALALETKASSIAAPAATAPPQSPEPAPAQASQPATQTPKDSTTTSK